MTVRHWPYRVVLHGAPLPDKPEENATVLYECVSKREALHLIAEEIRKLRGQGNWDVTGSARDGYMVVAMDRTDLSGASGSFSHRR
jgi:hypothetical protein